MSRNHKWPRTAIPNDVLSDGIEWNDPKIPKAERDAMLVYAVAVGRFYELNDLQSDLRKVAALGDAIGVPLDDVLRQRLREVRGQRQTARRYMVSARKKLARIRNGR